MAAPTPTARVTPTGIPLETGHSTLFTISLDTNISFWEKTPKPAGIDNGDKIPTTTHHNTTWRTFAPRPLLEMTDATIVAAYDPIVHDELVAIIGKRKLGSTACVITEKYPDTSTLCYYGYVKSAEKSDNVEENQPELTVTIVVTNWDPINNVEASPVLTNVSGT